MPRSGEASPATLGARRGHRRDVQLSNLLRSRERPSARFRTAARSASFRAKETFCHPNSLGESGFFGDIAVRPLEDIASFFRPRACLQPRTFLNSNALPFSRTPFVAAARFLTAARCLTTGRLALRKNARFLIAARATLSEGFGKTGMQGEEKRKKTKRRFLCLLSKKKKLTPSDFFLFFFGGSPRFFFVFVVFVLVAGIACGRRKSDARLEGGKNPTKTDAPQKSHRRFPGAQSGTHWPARRTRFPTTD